MKKFIFWIGLIFLIGANNLNAQSGLESFPYYDKHMGRLKIDYILLCERFFGVVLFIIITC